MAISFVKIPVSFARLRSSCAKYLSQTLHFNPLMFSDPFIIIGQTRALV